MCFFPTFAASFGFRLTLFAMNAYYYPDFQSFQKSLWFIDRALLVLGSYIHRPRVERDEMSPAIRHTTWRCRCRMCIKKPKGQDEPKKVSRVWPELYMIKSMKQEELFWNLPIQQKMLHIPATENVFWFLFPTHEDPCQKKF